MTVCDVVEDYFRDYNLSKNGLGYYLLRESIMVCWWKGLLFNDALMFLADPKRKDKISSLEWECEKTLSDAGISDTPEEFTEMVFSKVSHNYKKEDELWQVKIK